MPHRRRAAHELPIRVELAARVPLGPDAVGALYTDDFLFEDEILDARFTDKATFGRMHAPYANTDPTNGIGIGIHNFQVKDYLGDADSGVILWTWTATHCASFLGMPTSGRTIATDGHSYHVYRDGLIARESAYWDVVPVMKQLGQPLERDVAPQSVWPFSLSAAS